MSNEHDRAAPCLRRQNGGHSSHGQSGPGSRVLSIGPLPLWYFMRTVIVRTGRAVACGLLSLELKSHGTASAV